MKNYIVVWGVDSAFFGPTDKATALKWCRAFNAVLRAAKLQRYDRCKVRLLDEPPPDPKKFAEGYVKFCGRRVKRAQSRLN